MTALGLVVFGLAVMCVSGALGGPPWISIPLALLSITPMAWTEMEEREKRIRRRLADTAGIEFHPDALAYRAERDAERADGPARGAA